MALAKVLASKEHQSCRAVGHRYVVDEVGCDLFAVNVNICVGSCLSFSFVDPRQDQEKDGSAAASLSVFVQCCRMVEAQMLNVTIQCTDGARTVQVASTTKCSCVDCSR